jgi:hypothetical protein
MIINNIYDLIEEVKWEALGRKDKVRRVFTAKLRPGRSLARVGVASLFGKKATKLWYGDKNAKEETNTKQETTTEKVKRHTTSNLKSVGQTVADNVIGGAVVNVGRAIDMGVSDAKDAAKATHNLERISKLETDNNKRNSGGQTYQNEGPKQGTTRNKQTKATSLSRFQFLANKKKEIYDEHPQLKPNT